MAVARQKDRAAAAEVNKNVRETVMAIDRKPKEVALNELLDEKKLATSALEKLLEEQGQTFTLADGKSAKAVVEEVPPEGFAGFVKKQAKAEKAEAERYKAAKELGAKGG